MVDIALAAKSSSFAWNTHHDISWKSLCRIGITINCNYDGADKHQHDRDAPTGKYNALGDPGLNIHLDKAVPGGIRRGGSELFIY